MNIIGAARTTLLVVALAFAAATPAGAQVRYEFRGASADNLPVGTGAWWRAMDREGRTASSD